MKQTNMKDISTAYDKNRLVDIQDVHVDPDLPRAERITEFVRQIKDPYHFRCGGFIIHAKYNPDGPSLEDCLKQAIL